MGSVATSSSPVMAISIVLEQKALAAKMWRRL